MDDARGTSEHSFSENVGKIEECASALRAEVSQSTTEWGDAGFPTKRAVFAAFEAGRKDPRHAVRKRYNWFYGVFLILTFLSPIPVIWFGPDEQRPLIWDMIGVGSTLVLLAGTYGVYTVKVAAKSFGDMVNFALNIVFFCMDWRRESRLSKKRKIEVDRGGAFAFWNVILFILGTLIGLYAFLSVLAIFQRDLQGTLEPKDFVNRYLRFFIAVLLLSILFIIMDLCVAFYEKSHSESFVASSSVIHSTVPMFFGLAIIGIYLFGSAGDPEKFAATEAFISGALSFQMILSNFLFILIKQNYLLRILYVSVETSSRD